MFSNNKKEEPLFIKDNFETGVIGFKFIESMRRGRYKLPTTIAELADNCEDAKAKNIWIDLVGPSKNISAIIVTDNGTGMDYKTLEGSFQLGYDRPRHHKELGKFGVGGTLGSLGVAGNKLTISRQAGVVVARSYNIDSMKAPDQWGTSHEEVVPWMIDLLNKQFGVCGSGTVIKLSNFDRDIFSTVKKNVENSIKNHFERVYCEKIANGVLSIKINGNLVNSVDPLCWFHPDVRKLHDEIIPGTNARLRVVDLEKVPEATTKGLGKNQGGYVFRCDRLIKGRIVNDEDWKGSWTAHPFYRHSRWGLYYDANEDDLFGTTMDKCDINVSQSLMDIVRDIVVDHANTAYRRNHAKKPSQTQEEQDAERRKLEELVNALDKTKRTGKSSGKSTKSTNKVTTLPTARLPSYIIRSEPLGVIAEPFLIQLNPDQTESRNILKMNSDHRYVSKYYINGSKETQQATQALLYPLAIAIHNHDSEECSFDDFRRSFNEKLTEAQSKIDRS